MVGVAAFTLASVVPAMAMQRGAGREDASAGNESDVIWSQVTVSGTGTGGAGGGAPLTSRDTTWVPPVCWLQPLHTPEEFAELMADERAHSGSAQSDWLADIRAVDYHQGEDGHWWGTVFNQHLPEEEARGECAILRGNEVWVETGADPPAGEAVGPEMLAEVAYAATRLPPPQATLRPPPDAQRVNLDVHVALAADALPGRVTTTASMDHLGVRFAATVVAVPRELRVEAGTEYADPAVCEYRLDGSEVDTAGADCNVTYRRASDEAGYPLRVELTWDVHWTASADPDGAVAEVLPDGFTASEQLVTVREIQTVVR